MSRTARIFGAFALWTLVLIAQAAPSFAIPRYCVEVWLPSNEPNPPGVVVCTP